jgi:hypothetical protein
LIEVLFKASQIVFVVSLIFYLLYLRVFRDVLAAEAMRYGLYLWGPLELLTWGLLKKREGEYIDINSRSRLQLVAFFHNTLLAACMASGAIMALGYAIGVLDPNELVAAWDALKNQFQN